MILHTLTRIQLVELLLDIATDRKVKDSTRLHAIKNAASIIRAGHIYNTSN
jgi:hypothetical protein